MNESPQSKGNKIKKINLVQALNWVLGKLGWIFGVFFLLASFSFLIDRSFTSGILFLIMAAIIFPPINGFIKKRIYVELSGGLKSTIVILLFLVYALYLNESGTNADTYEGPIIVLPENLNYLNFDQSTFFKIDNFLIGMSAPLQTDSLAILKQKGNFISFSVAIENYEAYSRNFTYTFILLDTENNTFGRAKDTELLFINELSLKESPVKDSKIGKPQQDNALKFNMFDSLPLQPKVPNFAILIFKVPDNFEGHVEIRDTNNKSVAKIEWLKS